MAWLMDLLTSAGVESTPASWCVCAVTVLCIYSVFRLILELCKND